MKHFIRGAAAALALVSLSSGAFAECTIFQKENFEGGHGVIAPNDLVKFFEGEVKFSGVPEDARVFTDVSWRDGIGSVKLTNGCEMITYDKPEASIKHRRYVKDPATMTANMNTEVATLAAAAHCSCK